MTQWVPDYGLIADLDQARTLTDRLRTDALAGMPFAFDIETGYDGEPCEEAQLHPETGFVVSISFTNSLHWARNVPLRHDSGPNVDNYQFARLLWPLMATGMGVPHNGTFERRFMSRWFMEYLADDPDYGQQVREAHLGDPSFGGYFPVRSDTMLEAHATGMHRSVGLKELTGEPEPKGFGRKMMELPELFALHTGKELTQKQRKQMRFNVLDLMGPHRQQIIDYACEDTLWTLAHHKRRYPIVTSPNFHANLIYRTEMAIQPIVCAMEDEGLCYDWQLMSEGALRGGIFRDKLTAEINADLTALLVERGITEPCKVSLASPAQIAYVLYTQLGIAQKRKSRKTGNPSTDKIAMAGLKDQYPVVKKILNWKSLTKLIGTYLEKYPLVFNYADDGRAHPHHIQTGVPAGRFAVSGPPYQQSPKTYHYELAQGGAYDFNFRDSIKAPTGWYILGYDYSQAELRVLAGEAGETALVEAFARGDDVHKLTAALMLRKALEEITKDDRAVGKTMNFAMAYQMGVDGLADRLGITKDEAQDLFDQYFAAYPRIKAYMERIVAQSKRDVFVMTRFGRRVPIWEYYSDKQYIQAEGERLAGNAPIQGGAADYMKVAMVRAIRALADAGLQEKVRLVMNMHDALEFYVRKDVAPLDVIKVLQPAVVYTLPVIEHWPPMVAEWHAGLRWGSVRELGVEVDQAGVPVALAVEQEEAAPLTEVSGDEDVPEADVALARALARSLVSPVPDTLPSEPAGLPDAGPGRGPDAAPVPGHVAPVAPAGPCVVNITVTEMPGMEAVHRLKAWLDANSGKNTAVLRTPEGEVTLSVGSGITPASQSEVSLLFQHCMVTYDLDSVDPSSITGGMTF